MEANGLNGLVIVGGGFSLFSQAAGLCFLLETVCHSPFAILPSLSLSHKSLSLSLWLYLSGILHMNADAKPPRLIQWWLAKGGRGASTMDKVIVLSGFCFVCFLLGFFFILFITKSFLIIKLSFSHFFHHGRYLSPHLFLSRYTIKKPPICFSIRNFVSLIELGGHVSFLRAVDPNKEVIKQLNMVNPNKKDVNGQQLLSCPLHLVGPDKKVKFSLMYPATMGRNVNEVLRVVDFIQKAAKHCVATLAKLDE